MQNKQVRVLHSLETVFWRLPKLGCSNFEGVNAQVLIHSLQLRQWSQMDSSIPCFTEATILFQVFQCKRQSSLAIQAKGGTRSCLESVDKRIVYKSSVQTFRIQSSETRRGCWFHSKRTGQHTVSVTTQDQVQQNLIMGGEKRVSKRWLSAAAVIIFCKFS